MPSRFLSKALATAALAVGGVSIYTSWVLSGKFRPEPNYTFSPYEINVDADEVTFESSDGVRIAGWWFEDTASDTVLILSHGHRGDKSSMLGLGPKLHLRGHSVLLFDFRGSGESEDGPRSLAHYEQRDLRAAIEWVAARRPDAKIVLVGMSMGAATSLHVGAEDDRVKALVLDSPFATADGVVAANLAKFRLPRWPFLGATEGITRRHYGWSLQDVRPIDVIGNLTQPTLLMHGTHDRITPFEHSLQLRDAAKPGVVEYHAFPDADHCGGYFLDRPGYVARVDDFIRRKLGSEPAGR